MFNSVLDYSSVLMPAIHAVLVSLLYIWTTTESSLIVNTTFLESAIAKGAVCLDGSAPAFNFHPGTGSGVYNWLIQLQGGGWCDSTSDCQDRATNEYGTSKNISKISYFMGVLSNDSQQNPDLYNWNRVKVRYCDGSSYTGDIEQVDPVTNLHFRGARIFKAIMEELLYHKGMIYAENAILSGTSAGGLGAILHCDKFRLFFSSTARVKCISDAGFFINAKTITGEPHIKEYFKRVVALHGSVKNLPLSCTFLSLDPSLCFFPQYAAQHICTPLFIINSAYDSFQINNSLVPESVDPQHVWDTCKKDINKCSASQIQTLQEFRSTFLEALNELGPRGYFISSCHLHKGIEIQSYWSDKNSPTIANKTIAEVVGDWFSGRSGFQGVSCPYPCAKYCQ